MVRFRGLPVKKKLLLLLLYGFGMAAASGRGRKAYLPVFSCDTGEFTFKRFLADFSSIFKEKSRIQRLCDLSIYKRTK